MDNNEHKETATGDDSSVTKLMQMEEGEEMAASQGIQQSILWRFKWPFGKRTTITIIIGPIVTVCLIIIIVIWCFVFLQRMPSEYFPSGRIRKKEDQAIVQKKAAGKSPTSPRPLYIISCPKGWVGYEGRCFFFSSMKGTWDFSQRQCSSLDASLASVDTQEDMDFMMRYKISADHWFGLRRVGEGQPWKWTNDSIFSNWFNISDNGFCAYLNDKGAFSARCDTSRNWICTKSLHSFRWEKRLCLPTNTSLLDSGYQLMEMNCSVPES